MKILGNDGKEYKTIRECEAADKEYAAMKEAEAEKKRQAEAEKEAANAKETAKREELKKAMESARAKVDAARVHYDEMVKLTDERIEKERAHQKLVLDEALKEINRAKEAYAEAAKTYSDACVNAQRPNEDVSDDDDDMDDDDWNMVGYLGRLLSLLARW